MDNRVEGLEKVVGEHAVKIEGLHKEVEHNKNKTERLYDKFDEMVRILGDIREALAVHNVKSEHNQYIVGLLIAIVGAVAYALFDKYIGGL